MHRREVERAGEQRLRHLVGALEGSCLSFRSGDLSTMAIDTWCAVPAPGVPQGTLPGSAFAAITTPAMVVNLDVLAVTTSIAESVIG